MKNGLLKKTAVFMLLVVMIATAGIAMAESVETRTQTKSAIVNGMVDTLFAHPHNLNEDEAKEFSSKYLGSLTDEELDEKYQFTLEADEAFRIAWNGLKYTDGIMHFPAVGVQVISADADGKSVKITMSLKETGETVHVMEYVYELKGARTLDIQCSSNYTHEFVSGMGEVLTVAEGSDLTISLAHQGLNEETLNMSYEWINSATDESIATGNTIRMTDIRSAHSIACIAWNGEERLEMVFFEIGVDAGSSEPVWNGFSATATGKYELNGDTLYVEKNAQITVTASYTYDGSSTQQIYWNFNNGNGWQALDSKTANCTFTFTESGRLGFTLNDNGPVIDEVLLIEEYVTESEPVKISETCKVLVGSEHFGRVSPLRINEVGQAFSGATDSVEMNVAVGEGITLNSTTNFNIFFTAEEKAHGEKVTATLSDNAGKVYIVEYTIEILDAVRKDMTQSAEGSAELTKRADPTAYNYDLTVEEGTVVTLYANYETLSGGTPAMTYDWWFINEDDTQQVSEANSYTFTATMEHDGKGIELYVEGKDNSDIWDNIWIYVDVTERTTPETTATPTPEPTATPTPAPSITTEIRTENREMIVNGTVSTLFAHPHNKTLDETKEFDAKYLAGMTDEELDAKYLLTAEADKSFKIVWSDLKYTDGKQHVPSIGVQPASAAADGKSVKIFMSLRESGEVVHVMEYVIDVTAERSLDIQCSGGYTHEFVSGMGEVLKVADGSDLTISVAHKGVGETLNMSYEWINAVTDTPIGTGNTMSLTNIRSASSIACIAMNGSDSVEMIFFEIDVDASLPATTPTPAPTTTPAPTATSAPTATPAPTPTVEVKVEEQTDEQKQNQTVTVVIPDDTVEEAIQNAQSNVVVFPVDQAPVEEELSVTTAKASVSAFEELAESNKAVSITMSHAEVVMQPEVIEQIAASADAGSEIEICVEQKKPQEALSAVQQQAFEDQKVAAVITADVFMKEGNTRTKIDFNGKVTLKVPFTAPAGESGHDYVIVFVADNGQTEMMPTYYTNGLLVFETSHFSDFVITTRTVNTDTNVPTTTPPKTGDNAVPFLWLLGMVIAAGGYIALTAKRRQHN